MYRIGNDCHNKHIVFTKTESKIQQTQVELGNNDLGFLENNALITGNI